MKTGYWSFGVLPLYYLARVAYVFYQNWKYNQANEEIDDALFNHYLKLREETFALKPGDLGIADFTGEESAFAVMLEIHTGSAIEALVAFADGQIWMYNTQNGRNYTLYKSSDELKARAVEAVRVSQYHFARMRRKNAEKLLPAYAKFHILTNLDVYSVDGLIDDMLHESSQWEELATSMLAVAEEWNEVAKNTPLKRVYPKFTVKRIKPANL